MLRTKFWRSAAASLPAAVRNRYLANLEQAERWELALDDALQLLSRVRGGFARTFHTPKNA